MRPYMALHKGFVWAIMICASTLFGQNGTVFQKIGQSTISSEEKIAKADSLIAIAEEVKSDSLMYFYQDYGYWLYDANEREASVKYETLALNEAKKNSQKNKAFIQKSSLYLGFYLAQTNQLREAIQAYREVLLIDNTNDNASKAHQQIGTKYIDLKDYYKGIFHLQEAASYLEKQNSRLHNLFTIYINLILAHRILGEDAKFEQSKAYVKSADSLLNYIDVPHSKKYDFYLNAAQVYNQYTSLNIDKANYYYNQALEIGMLLNDSTKLRDVYFEKGMLYNTTELQKSLQNFDNSSTYLKEKDTLGRFYTKYGRGLAYSLSGDLESATKYSSEALHVLLSFQKQDLNKFVDSTYRKVKYKTQLLDVSTQLAESYLSYYEETKTNKYLDKSLKYFKLADRVLDIINMDGNEYRSRLFWRKISTDLYGKAIRASYLKGDNQSAFYFVEKNKALLLLEDIAKREFLHTQEIPDHLLARRLNLNKLLVELESNLDSSVNIDNKQRLLVSTRIALDKLEDSLNNYRKNINISPKLISLNRLQNKIEKDEIILEYHISIDDGYGAYSNNKRGYLLVITQNDFEIHELQNIPLLRENVLSLITLLKTPQTSHQNQMDHVNISHALFEKLFPSSKIMSLVGEKKLIIIPDSFLSYLPFEALNTKPEKDSYLIKSSEIRYTYSNSFAESLSKNSTVNSGLLAMAPIEFGNQELHTLHFSEDEISGLGEYFSGDILNHFNATKAHFLSNINDKQIIHLATHAGLGTNRDPWIAFRDDKISLAELYLTTNNASMVVLSGCNTILGKEEIGEGLMSLARGFFYSGSQSVVASLWNIDDKSTSQIMRSFYKNLKQGETKSAALRNAKLDYLRTHELSETSPYYWSAFVLMGDNSAIDDPSNLIWYASIGGLILLGVLFIIFRNKLKRAGKIQA